MLAAWGWEGHMKAAKQLHDERVCVGQRVVDYGVSLAVEESGFGGS